ncbi:STAS domain-containing protein [Oleiagrimonas sp. C23AA]|uniref:STAS domain-containing protein n=1 Tax=Oleiagrimonas sp. C23AA TaxID=2719047 RepID=UPI001423C1A5|nr:STAS domain-containing protein [Oleiagrimonas sp. C23AA]NII09224.1 STAS domain-containing protein [Oleiagrimonas sp. C23AA]
MATSKNDKAAAPAHLALGAEVRMSGVGPLQEALKNARDSAGPVTLDASEVGSVDAAALQLIYVFVEDCRQREIACQWQGVSDAFRQGATLLGLTDKLDLPAAAASA